MCEPACAIVNKALKLTWMARLQPWRKARAEMRDSKDVLVPDRKSSFSMVKIIV